MHSLLATMHYWLSLLPRLAFEELVHLLVQEFKVHVAVSESVVQGPPVPRACLVPTAIHTGEGRGFLHTLQFSVSFQ